MQRLSAALFAATLIAGHAGYIRASQAQTPQKRFFTITAVEPRGGVNVSQEPFPAEPLPPGGGYVIRQPDQTGRWEISAYMWAPSQVVVHQGTRSRLNSSASMALPTPPRSRGWTRRSRSSEATRCRSSSRPRSPGSTRSSATLTSPRCGQRSSSYLAVESGLRQALSRLGLAHEVGAVRASA